MPAIQCPTCQKEYRWRPELAGKRVKCKCGEVIAVPADEPQPDPNDLYDLVEEPAPKAQHAISDVQAGTVASPVAVASGNQFPCPYCGEMVEAGVSMCVFCGSSLDGAPVAEKAKRKRPTAMQAAPPVAARPVKMRPETEEEKAGKAKLIAMGVVALALLIGAVFGMKYFMPKSASKDPNLKPGDAAILAKIDDEHGKEAKEWLNANDAHMLGGWSKKQALYKVDEIYQMGAKKVVAFGAAYSMSVAIELPDDPAKRKVLFDWQTKWQHEHMEKADKDEGQKWFEVSTPR